MESRQYFDIMAPQWDNLRRGFFSEAVREMTRILKPGGMLAITDLDRHDFEFLRTEHCDRWMGFDRPDVARWFAEAGLADVLIDRVGETCCAASHSGCGQAAVSIFVASGMKS